jgi:hypothetical protein
MAEKQSMARQLFSFRLAAAALLFALPALDASGEELRARKAGLWEMTVLMSNSEPAVTMQNCTDETTDEETKSLFAPFAKQVCPKKDVLQKTATATGYVIDSVCSGVGTPTTSHTEFTGDYNSAYTMKTISHRERGPANPPRDVTITIEAKWLGPCKADQKPGDTWVGGYKLTIEDTKNRMKYLVPK